jgi:hypothetical protein
VFVGETEREPVFETEPMFEMFTDVAFCEDQVIEAESPELILDGEAEIVQLGT